MDTPIGYAVNVAVMTTRVALVNPSPPSVRSKLVKKLTRQDRYNRQLRASIASWKELWQQRNEMYWEVQRELTELKKTVRQPTEDKR